MNLQKRRLDPINQLPIVKLPANRDAKIEGTYGTGKTTIAIHRFASRAKIAQQLETIALTDSVGQRRVVVSTDAVGCACVNTRKVPEQKGAPAL